MTTIRSLLFLGLVAACAKETPPPTVDTVATSSAPRSYRLLGTEPFWGLTIDSTGLRFTTPEDQVGHLFPLVAPVVSGDTTRWVGLAESDSFDVRIWKETCSDGMSDNSYPFTATARIGGRDLKGCARE